MAKRIKRIPPPPPGESWVLQYVETLAEAECAAGELASAAEVPGKFDRDPRADLEQLIDQLLNTSGGALYAAQQLREALTRRKPPPSTNAYLRRECVHVANGEPPIDHVKVSTVGQPPPLTYRYQKGPDEVKVCAQCALALFGLLMEQTGQEMHKGTPE